jgi:hypothetical protein
VGCFALRIAKQDTFVGLLYHFVITGRRTFSEACPFSLTANRMVPQSTRGDAAIPRSGPAGAVVYTNEQNFLFHTLLMKSGLPKSLIEVPQNTVSFSSARTTKRFSDVCQKKLPLCASIHIVISGPPFDG